MNSEPQYRRNTAKHFFGWVPRLKVVPILKRKKFIVYKHSSCNYLYVLCVLCYVTSMLVMSPRCTALVAKINENKKLASRYSFDFRFQLIASFLFTRSWRTERLWELFTTVVLLLLLQFIELDPTVAYHFQAIFCL